MRRVVAVENVTLDGVMQSPASPDEDPRDGFEHGGWAVPYGDEVMMAEMGKGMGQADLLFGRRTYEQFYSFWPKQTGENPFTKLLGDTPKFVASTTLTEPLPWENSTLLSGDAAKAVASLRREDGRDLAILGSGVLVRSLMDHDLVDQYLLLIHPIVLGSGRRLFAADGPTSSMRLANSVTTTTGVVIATYEATEETPAAG